ncbi:tetratricopeptide repeat protein [Nocardia sp. NPDC019395]|uniref:tetratricopeptide repeat protein n=1 Tax=Nocardia sp. NPDC019395 TaxID=3154686 RepID=UPI0033F2B1D4
MREPLPPSSVVPGVLGGLSVLATTLLLELGRNLVMNSFGESDGVRLLSSGLRWLALLIVALAVLYSGYRVAVDRRARLRLVDRRRTLAVLDGARPVGPAVPRPVSLPEVAYARDLHSEFVEALGRLPVIEYDAATLSAILSAVADVHDGEPRPPADGRWTAPGLREWLLDGDIMIWSCNRYGLMRVPATASAHVERVGEIWQAALFGLLSHCAEQASSWAVALTTVPFAPGARRWFTVEEPYLRELVRRCGTGGFAWPIPAATVVQLVRIADALDVWYAHQVRVRDDKSAVVAENLLALTARSRLSWFERLMRVRRPVPADSETARRRPGVDCGLRRRATGLAARWDHREALARLRTAVTPDDLTEAVRQLRSAWWRLPREDVTNQVRVLVNLAVAHIEQGRLDAAADRLELAAVRAVEEEDAEGRALVHELDGAVCWARGEPRGALRHWQRALGIYQDLADDRGVGRCLQHIGSAVLVAEEHGDLVLGADTAPAAADMPRCAHGWLAEALLLFPGAAVAADYSVEAAAIRGGAEPPEIGRRPLPLRDESAEAEP